jgi:serine/threonine-protein kinase
VSTPATEPALTPGTTIGGRYRIVRLVGTGGMGAVYEAQHTHLKKRVALKTLYPRLARVPEARARFLREGEAASRMRHPHIVDVTDVGSDGETPFLVMEYLEGEDLSALLARSRRLSLEESLELLLPAIAAVAAGHTAGIVHRDLKPQNVFLAKGYAGDIVPKVLDFGVSKLAAEGEELVALTGTAAVFGTPAYMSPEQARGAKGVDARSDQYSMAAVLYECVTGRRAHEGDHPLAVVRKIGDGDLVPPRQHRPDLPEAFEQLLLRALAREPGDRFASMSDFGKALVPFASPRSRLLWGPVLGLPRQPLPQAALRKTEPLPAAVHKPEPAASKIEPGPGRLARTVVLPTPPSTTFNSVAGQVVPTETAWGRHRRMIIAVAAGVALAVGGGYLALRSGDDGPRVAASAFPAPPTARVPIAVERAEPPATPVKEKPRIYRPDMSPTYFIDVTPEPADAVFTLDGAPAGPGRLRRELVRDGQRHRLALTAPGYTARTLEFDDVSPPSATLALTREEAPQKAKAKTPRKRRSSVDDLFRMDR